MRFVFSNLKKIFFKNDGFALIEVSIALIVLGVLMGVGLPSFLHYLKWQKVRETKERQEEIMYSVSSFVLHYGYVPLPADPHAAAATFGESRLYAESKTDFRGIVPFKTLGLSERYAKDGFGRYLTYIGGSPQKRDPDASHQSSFCASFPLYELRVSERRPCGTLSERPMHMAEKDPTILILMSHGASGYGAYQGVPGQIKKASRGAHSGKDKAHNADGTLHVISAGHSEKKTQSFDDIVRWVTRDNLMAFYAKSPCFRKEEDHVGYMVI